MSRPSSVVRSSPRLFFPRFECSSSTWTSVLHHADAARQQPAHGVAALDVLDLDDLGAPVGEEGGGRRHEGVLGDLEDADTLHHGGHPADHSSARPGAYRIRRATFSSWSAGFSASEPRSRRPGSVGRPRGPHLASSPMAPSRSRHTADHRPKAKVLTLPGLGASHSELARRGAHDPVDEGARARRRLPAGRLGPGAGDDPRHRRELRHLGAASCRCSPSTTP